MPAHLPSADPGSNPPAMDGRVSAWELRTAVDLEAVNVFLPALEAAGLLGIVDQDGLATVYFPQPVAGLPIDGTWRPVEQQDWLEVWKAGLDPVTIGGLRITPPWIDAGPDALVIEPGAAFGTGHHESTAGCLAALQEVDLRGRGVLDIGTGSGILAIAAVRLGAEPVVAVDRDPLAVAAARSNAARNGAHLEVRQGSLDGVTERFPVVVANLDGTDMVLGLVPMLPERLAPGGTLIVSGVSVERQAEAVDAFTQAGQPMIVREGREWVVLVGRAPTG
ncbi:MAG: methyltransferase [Nitriliruptorales bacterium]|nr:methyltransferase [Nitriliruptorales bacterium]